MAQANNGQDDFDDGIVVEMNRTILKTNLTMDTDYRASDIQKVDVIIESSDRGTSRVKFDPPIDTIDRGYDVDESLLKLRVDYAIDLRYRGRRGEVYITPDGDATLYEPHKTNATLVLKNGE
jgi:hypothetical protein